MRHGLAALLPLLAAAAWPAPAAADEYHQFVQISCVPELGYAAVRKFGIWNPPFAGPYLTKGLEPGAGVLRQMEARSGIYQAEGLKARPQTCRIPAISDAPGSHEPRPASEVRIVGHFDRPLNERVSSYRQMVNWVEVLVDGRSVARIEMSLYEAGDEPELVEVSAYEPRITICTVNAETKARLCSEVTTGAAGTG